MIEAFAEEKLRELGKRTGVRRRDRSLLGQLAGDGGEVAGPDSVGRAWLGVQVCLSVKQTVTWETVARTGSTDRCP